MNPTKIVQNSDYIETIFRTSDRYLDRIFTKKEKTNLKNRVYKRLNSHRVNVVREFTEEYRIFVKEIHQKEHSKTDDQLSSFIKSDISKVGVIWGDSFNVLNTMKSESVQLMVTSPPYYNARSYSTWPDIDKYLDDMKLIIKESYRVLDNHRPFVFNVGDIFDNDHKHTRSSWGKRRIPLGAYFTKIFEDVGFQFVDDFIWDKGEVESQRHKNANNPYPLYQYPINCYEHVFVFYKHRLDNYLYPCPICGCLKVNGNAYSGIGVKSWECKNLKCMKRSAGNRGKRFSNRTYIMNGLKKDENIIDVDLLKKWRRDIVKLNPVIKINSKGENTLGHTAPFPNEIPAYAIEVFTGKNEVVFDPFAGSFTTSIEAIKRGRNGIGVELNKSMFRNSILKNIARNNLLFKELDKGGGIIWLKKKIRKLLDYTVKCVWLWSYMNVIGRYIEPT